MSAPLRSDAGPGLSLVELLLEEQADLSAVERFALREVEADAPAMEPFYEELIPSSLPGAGEQYAFRVDLDACTGCKACVTACHSLNGLDEGETWRRVGLLVGVDAGAAVQQTVTGACHHCEDPGCMSGCPVKAYEKDEVTGIVRHLDDQCIGCKYCTLTCPYDVPQYNERLGIVRKCDMCTGRLAEGEAPACVQGCPNGAISIAIVPTGGAAAPVRDLLPSPASELISTTITRPTTRYVRGREPAGANGVDVAPRRLQAADRDVVSPNHAHWPLALLLVLVQTSVGLATVELVMRALGVGGAAAAGWLLAAIGAAAAGQVAAFFHVGRPLYAWRAVLGLRTSWMSREIVALGLYLGALSLHFALAVLAPGFVPDLAAGVPFGAGVTGAAAVAAGALGVTTSVMLYVVTGRPLWSARRTTLRFASTAFILGSGAGAAIALVTGAPVVVSLGLASAGALAAAAKLVVEARTRDADLDSGLVALVRSARLEHGVLAPRVRARMGLVVGGFTALLAATFASAAGAPLPLAAAVALAGAGACFAGELGERHLFFAAEASRGMPGA